MPTSAFADGSYGGVRDSAWSLFQGSARTILPILICTDSEEDTQRLDEAVEELLSSYGYSDSDVLLTKDFRGSWLRLRVLRKREGERIETGFVLELGKEPSSTQLPPEKRERFGKLRGVLESVKGFLVVGTLLVVTIGEGYELVKKYHEVFPSEPTPVVAPAPPDSRKIAVARLPQAVIPAVVNAESDPEKLKFLFGYTLADQLQSPDLLADRRKIYPPPGKPSNPSGQ